MGSLPFGCKPSPFKAHASNRIRLETSPEWVRPPPFKARGLSRQAGGRPLRSAGRLWVEAFYLQGEGPSSLMEGACLEGRGFSSASARASSSGVRGPCWASQSSRKAPSGSDGGCFMGLGYQGAYPCIRAEQPVTSLGGRRKEETLGLEGRVPGSRLIPGPFAPRGQRRASTRSCSPGQSRFRRGAMEVRAAMIAFSALRASINRWWWSMFSLFTSRRYAASNHARAASTSVRAGFYPRGDALASRSHVGALTDPLPCSPASRRCWRALGSSAPLRSHGKALASLGDSALALSAVGTVSAVPVVSVVSSVGSSYLFDPFELETAKSR